MNKAYLTTHSQLKKATTCECINALPAESLQYRPNVSPRYAL